MTVYVSMSMNNDTLVNKDIQEYLHRYNPTIRLTYYTPPEPYSLNKLSESNVCLLYIPVSKMDVKNTTSWEQLYLQMGNMAGYLSKGQFSEMEYCLEKKKPVYILTYDTLFTFTHYVPNDYNDWKGKYAKIWCDTIIEFSKVFPMSNEECLLI